MKNFFIAIAFSLLSLTAWAERYLELPQGNFVDSMPQYQFMDYDVKEVSDGYIVTYQFNAFELRDCPEYANTVSFHTPALADNSVLGQPAIPISHDVLMIGSSDDYDVKVIDVEYKEFTLDISPAYGETVDPSVYLPIEPINPYTGFYPNDFVCSTEAVNNGGEYLLDICLSPVMYDYSNHVARVCTSLTYKVTCDTPNTFAETKRYVSSKGDGIDLLSYTPNPYDPNKAYAENYVIVTTPKFQNQIDIFANWKRTMGFNIQVLYPEGDVWASFEDVKTAVANARTQRGGIDYLLIVGDFNEVPAEYLNDSYVGSTLSDYKLATGGSSALPICSYGRIPVSNAIECFDVISKIIGYECNPPEDGSFYKRGLHVGTLMEKMLPSGSNDFIHTSEVCRVNNIDAGYDVTRKYFAYNVSSINSNKNFDGNLEVDSILLNRSFYEKAIPYPSPELTASDYENASISQEINNGVSYVAYFGHGEVNRWGHPNYRANHLQYLKNGNLLPVVFSSTCLTGKYYFDKDSDLIEPYWDDCERCFAKEFLIKKNGGCVGIIASSNKIYQYFNNRFYRIIFDLIWPDNHISSFLKKRPNYIPEHSLRLGDILANAIKSYPTTANVSIRAISTDILGQQLFGDPSMRMYTEAPETIKNVNIATSQKDGVYVLSASSDNGEEYILWDMDTNEVVKADNALTDFTSPKSFSNYKICITGNNRIPYIANVSDVANKTSIGYITSISKASGGIDVRATVSSYAPNHIITFEVNTLQGGCVARRTIQSVLPRTINIAMNCPAGIYVVVMKVNGAVADSKMINYQPY